jgi:Ricin-type beta-trefoil lectin domain
MRWIFAGAAFAVAGASLLAFNSSPIKAAVVSVGGGFGPPFGGFTCADVDGGNITPGTKVQAWDCLAGPNQQFEFYGPTIYTLGGQRCLDVVGAGTAPGTNVWSYTCNGTVAQQWTYDNGQIRYPHGGLCLDAGNLGNGTQLHVNTCNGSNSQTWQIK